MTLPKYSMGIGDRFGHQGPAQLQAFVQARSLGIEVTPVWNKSNREHQIIGTEPSAVRAEADAAVRECGWNAPYFVDADHIGMKTVDRFIAASDFFTLDVADFTGKSADESEIATFVKSAAGVLDNVSIDRLSRPLAINQAFLQTVARKYLLAIQEAGAIYRYVRSSKSDFVVEVSMDETDLPQTPDELLVILFGIAREGIPAQTIAPKFIGRFNKGVDYVGDPEQFAREFRDDLAVIDYAVKNFELPANLKLSVHSGSDKFSIYPAIRTALNDFGAGLHLKTAGTTWLEEVIGLAESGGEGLKIAQRIYARALTRMDELCGPYATVIDIDRKALPSADQANAWSSEQFVAALRHDLSNSAYNPNLRQLLHVGYKVAAEMGKEFLDALEANRKVIDRNVCTNLLDRHIKPIFRR